MYVPTLIPCAPNQVSLDLDELLADLGSFLLNRSLKSRPVPPPTHPQKNLLIDFFQLRNIGILVVRR